MQKYARTGCIYIYPYMETDDRTDPTDDIQQREKRNGESGFWRYQKKLQERNGRCLGTVRDALNALTPHKRIGRRFGATS